MKGIRFAFLFLVVVAVASGAEACMRCYTEPGRPFSTQGTCGPHDLNWCDRQCCGASIGDPCSIPDFMDECGYGLTATNESVVAVSARPARTRPDRAFTSRLLGDSQNMTVKRFRTCRT
jgi:hypothetical protein